MPGRLAVYDDISFKKDIFSSFGNFDDQIQVLIKRYNIAPTIYIPIFTNENIYTYAQFGLIPSWAKDKSSININARSETLFEKTTFKEAYRQRRCLIPINGYYEWKKDEDTKQSIPYHICSSHDDYLALAGIYEYWIDNTTGKTIISCALITCEPNSKIEKYHDRMPVVLKKNDWKTWLDKKNDFNSLNNLLKPIDDETIKIYEVNPLVNSVRNDSKECLEKTDKVRHSQATLF